MMQARGDVKAVQFYTADDFRTSVRCQGCFFLITKSIMMLIKRLLCSNSGRWEAVLPSQSEEKCSGRPQGIGSRLGRLDCSV